MTVVHNTPHPKAMQVLTPKNPQIAAKFGQVRVEDWDDRVAGFTAFERHARGGFPETNGYFASKDEVQTSTAERILYDDSLQIVRCHSTRTGELVLLHDDWL